jgi:hypothetical protein
VPLALTQKGLFGLEEIPQALTRFVSAKPPRLAGPTQGLFAHTCPADLDRLCRAQCLKPSAKSVALANGPRRLNFTGRSLLRFPSHLVFHTGLFIELLNFIPAATDMGRYRCSAAQNCCAQPCPMQKASGKGALRQ